MEPPLGVWSTYGFRQSPYSTTALQADSAESTLLVGRAVELRIILRDLVSGSSLIALEGDYGVGKSSLAAVAAYEASHWTVRQGDPWFLATSDVLELKEGDTSDLFEKRAFFKIAAAIMARSKKLRADGYELSGIDDFTKWLSSPVGAGWSAGIGVSVAQVGGVNLSGGRSKSPNTTGGFSDAGVIALVDGWLRELFPDPSRGGVICRLDNLESIGQSEYLVGLFESLRDRLFKRQGLRWIVSGAEGMVRVALGTPKMTGAFSEPIDIQPLSASAAPEVVGRRAAHYAARSNAVLPVDAESFESLYLRTGRSLRFTMGLAEQYALRTDPASVLWLEPTVRREHFERYVVSEAERGVRQALSKVTQKSLAVLVTLVDELSGFCSPGDHLRFGLQSTPSLQYHLDKLRALGFVAYAADHDDGRRRRVRATDNGRLAVALVNESAKPTT